MTSESEIIKVVCDFDMEKMLGEIKVLVDAIKENHISFLRALGADMIDAAALLRETDTGFTRRTYLRSFFSLVEGSLFAQRLVICEYIRNEADSRNYTLLNDAERMLLQEIEYTIDDNGRVKIRDQNFQPLLKFLRFTFDVVSKYFQRPNPVHYGGGGWAAFQTAHGVRNRITHPKSPQDLEITDLERNQLVVAVKWYFESLAKI